MYRCAAIVVATDGEPIVAIIASFALFHRHVVAIAGVIDYYTVHRILHITAAQSGRIRVGGDGNAVPRAGREWRAVAGEADAFVRIIADG